MCPSVLAWEPRGAPRAAWPGVVGAPPGGPLHLWPQFVMNTTYGDDLMNSLVTLSEPLPSLGLGFPVYKRKGWVSGVYPWGFQGLCSGRQAPVYLPVIKQPHTSAPGCLSLEAGGRTAWPHQSPSPRTYGLPTACCLLHASEVGISHSTPSGDSALTCIRDH